ncbi:MAG: biosynthetic arginine decarboxylase [Cyanobacteria bacterium P01_F01_bin.153]
MAHFPSQGRSSIGPSSPPSSPPSSIPPANPLAQGDLDSNVEGDLIGGGDRRNQGKYLSSEWTWRDSEALYRIHAWGDPYFSINKAGHVTVSPKADRGGSIDLFELVQALRERNLQLPLLIRFSDILADRIEKLTAAFSRAIARYKYTGEYRGVFPVKCNQQRHLVEDLVEFGAPYQFGLEAGSKPELMIALALLNTPGALLICNGYKDQDYIETAILSRRLGKTPIIVLEQLEELALVISASQRLGIRPIMGVRAKLKTKGMGHWGDSAGDRAKFGLTIPEIVASVEQLRAVSMLDCLQLLHFHVGSQIADINVIKDAIREASQIYVELHKLGAPMKYLDVGGGLGIDYDGSNTSSGASTNYSLQNYADDIVAAVQETCALRQVPAPTLVSESGRAIASHQSVLVFDILGVSQGPQAPPQGISPNAHLSVRELRDIYNTINTKNYQEMYHDATQYRDEALSLFGFGYLSLTDRATIERWYWACCTKIRAIARQEEYVPEDLAHLEDMMASTYYANLSVFQSAPDSWALDQLFPVMPIHRLNEEPTERGVLADLTCDSDGKINKFVGLRQPKSTLELHPLQLKEMEHPSMTVSDSLNGAPAEKIVAGDRGYAPYFLGMFLNGAYQEIMGNLHNLFGDTNAVHIHLTPQGYTIEHVVKGDTVNEVLGYVQYDVEDLIESMRRQTETAVQGSQLTVKESQHLLQNYERSLRGYTYLKS